MSPQIRCSRGVISAARRCMRIAASITAQIVIACAHVGVSLGRRFTPHDFPERRDRGIELTAGQRRRAQRFVSARARRIELNQVPAHFDDLAVTTLSKQESAVFSIRRSVIRFDFDRPPVSLFGLFPVGDIRVSATDAELRIDRPRLPIDDQLILTDRLFRLARDAIQIAVCGATVDRIPGRVRRPDGRSCRPGR